MEYWGSGIKRITVACKEYGSPIPEIVNEAGGVAVKCKPSDSYLKAMKGENNSVAQTINESLETGIIELIKENNKITQVEIAKILGVSRDVIKRNIKN